MLRRKSWTREEILDTPENEFRMFQICLITKAWRFLGLNVGNCWHLETDIETGEVILLYEENTK